MRESIRDQLLVAAFAALVLLPGLGATGLWDYDEALWAGTAAEMGRRDDWIVPFFNGELSIQKPPFMYWMMLIGTSIFGETDFAYRIGSALFGIAACVITYRIGRTIFDREVGLVAGAALATATMFDVVARGATPDSELVFFCTVALSCLMAPGTGSVGGGSPLLAGRLDWLSAVLMYTAMGFAVLTKGPIGILLPMLSIGIFLLLDAGLAGSGRQGGAGAFLGRCLRGVPRVVWQLRPVLGLVTFVAVVGPWFWFVQQQTEGAFGAGFLGTHNVQRFLQPFEKHRGSSLYYLPALLIGFFPWSMFEIPTVREAARRIVRPGRTGSGTLLLAVWIVTWIGFFSLAQTKLPNYILPAFPAAAVLTAAFLVGWARDDERASRFWMRTALALLTIFGVMAVGTCRILPQLSWDGVPLLRSLHLTDAVGDVLRVASFGGGIMMAGGLLGLLLLSKGRRTECLAFYTAMSAAFVLFIFTVAAREADRHQPTRHLLGGIAADGHLSRPIAQWGYPFPSLVHYSRGRVERCGNAADAVEFLRRHPDGVIVMATNESRDAPAPPPEMVVVGEYPAFPERGRLLVLSAPHAVGSRDRSDRPVR
jgi:4-amino-4-deoxy-L-arabinose transferase-like glycosyltransferase